MPTQDIEFNIRVNLNQALNQFNTLNRELNRTNEKYLQLLSTASKGVKGPSQATGRAQPYESRQVGLGNLDINISEEFSRRRALHTQMYREDSPDLTKSQANLMGRLNKYYKEVVGTFEDGAGRIVGRQVETYKKAIQDYASKEGANLKSFDVEGILGANAGGLIGINPKGLQHNLYGQSNKAFLDSVNKLKLSLMESARETLYHEIGHSLVGYGVGAIKQTTPGSLKTGAFQAGELSAGLFGGALAIQHGKPLTSRPEELLGVGENMLPLFMEAIKGSSGHGAQGEEAMAGAYTNLLEIRRRLHATMQEMAKNDITTVEGQIKAYDILLKDIKEGTGIFGGAGDMPNSEAAKRVFTTLKEQRQRFGGQEAPSEWFKDRQYEEIAAAIKAEDAAFEQNAKRRLRTNIEQRAYDPPGRLLYPDISEHPKETHIPEKGEKIETLATQTDALVKSSESLVPAQHRLASGAEELTVKIRGTTDSIMDNVEALKVQRERLLNADAAAIKLAGGQTAIDSSLKKTNNAIVDQAAQLIKTQEQAVSIGRPTARYKGEYLGEAIQKAMPMIQQMGLPEDVKPRVDTMINTMMKEATGGTLGGAMQTAMKRVTMWGGAAFMIYGVLRQVQKLTQEVLELDKAMHGLMAIMRDVPADFDEMENAAFSLAQQYGRSATEIIQAMTSIAKTGADQSEVLEMTKIAVLAANVAEIDLAESAKVLVAAQEQFNLQTSELIGVVDSWNEVSRKARVETSDLVDAMFAAGTAAGEMGMNYHELNAIIAATVEATGKSGQEIGTAFKAIMARTQMPKAVAALGDIGISTKTDTGDLRDFMDVLYDVAERWDVLTTAQRMNIANALAEKKRYQNFLALMENWDTAVASIAISLDSAGSAEKENAIIMESLEKKYQKFQASLQELKMGATDMLQSIGSVALQGLTGLTQFIDLLMRIPGVKVIASLTAIAMGFKLISQYLEMIGAKQMGAGIAAVVGPLISQKAFKQSMAAMPRKPYEFTAISQPLVSEMGRTGLSQTGRIEPTEQWQRNMPLVYEKQMVEVAARTSTKMGQKLLGGVKKVFSGLTDFLFSPMGIIMVGSMMISGVIDNLNQATQRRQDFFDSMIDSATQAATQIGEDYDIQVGKLEAIHAVQKTINDQLNGTIESRATEAELQERLIRLSEREKAVQGEIAKMAEELVDEYPFLVSTQAGGGLTINKEALTAWREAGTGGLEMGEDERRRAALELVKVFDQLRDAGEKLTLSWYDEAGNIGYAVANTLSLGIAGKITKPTAGLMMGGIPLDFISPGADKLLQSIIPAFGKDVLEKMKTGEGFELEPEQQETLRQLIFAQLYSGLQDWEGRIQAVMYMQGTSLTDLETKFDEYSSGMLETGDTVKIAEAAFGDLTDTEEEIIKKTMEYVDILKQKASLEEQVTEGVKETVVSLMAASLEIEKIQSIASNLSTVFGKFQVPGIGDMAKLFLGITETNLANAYTDLVTEFDALNQNVSDMESVVDSINRHRQVIAELNASEGTLLDVWNNELSGVDESIISQITDIIKGSLSSEGGGIVSSLENVLEDTRAKVKKVLSFGLLDSEVATGLEDIDIRAIARTAGGLGYPEEISEAIINTLNTSQEKAFGKILLDPSTVFNGNAVERFFDDIASEFKHSSEGGMEVIQERLQNWLGDFTAGLKGQYVSEGELGTQLTLLSNLRKEQETLSDEALTSSDSINETLQELVSAAQNHQQLLQAYLLSIQGLPFEWISMMSSLEQTLDLSMGFAAMELGQIRSGIDTGLAALQSNISPTTGKTMGPAESGELATTIGSMLSMEQAAEARMQSGSKAAEDTSDNFFRFLRTALEHYKTLEQVTLKQYIEALRYLESVAPTLADRIKVQEEIYQSEKELASKRLEYGRKWLDHETALERMTLGEKVAYYKQLQLIAQSRDDKWQLEEEIFRMEREAIDERLGKATKWLDHFVAMDAITKESQMKILKRMLEITKGSSDIYAQWGIEEKIHALQKEMDQGGESDFAKRIIRRASGMESPLRMSLGEYKKFMGEGAAATDEAKDMIAEFEKYMSEFGGTGRDASVQLGNLNTIIEDLIDTEYDNTMQTDDLKKAMDDLASALNAEESAANTASSATVTYSKHLTDSATKLGDWILKNEEYVKQQEREAAAAETAAEATGRGLGRMIEDLSKFHGTVINYMFGTEGEGGVPGVGPSIWNMPTGSGAPAPPSAGVMAAATAGMAAAVRAPYHYGGMGPTACTGDTSHGTPYGGEYAHAHRPDKYPLGCFDCSGLVAWSWGKAGVNLPHHSGTQWGSTLWRAPLFSPAGMGMLRPGAMLFPSDPSRHVAMYYGGGKVAEASSTGQPVMVKPFDSGKWKSVAWPQLETGGFVTKSGLAWIDKAEVITKAPVVQKIDRMPERGMTIEYHDNSNLNISGVGLTKQEMISALEEYSEGKARSIQREINKYV